MKTKAGWIVIAALAVVGAAFFILHHYRKKPYMRRVRVALARANEFRELPQDATVVEWELAEKTDWWGKPLDPRVFWKGKTVWLDMKASMEAHRRGRLYPPIPYGEKNSPHGLKKILRTGREVRKGTLLRFI